MENSLKGGKRVNNRRDDSELSLVIPLYQEGSHIKNSVDVIKKVLIDNKISYEFILVDDGSKDNTWEEIERMSIQDDKITSIRLSRNFGKEAALCAGLEYAKGDMVLVMDGDLQHPPSLIPEMVHAWREEGYDLVEGVKNSRGGKGYL